MENMDSATRNNIRDMSLCNCLMDILHAFILKSLHLLSDRGEMIFITPDIG